MASREASPEVDVRPTLGSLTLIGRKDGLVKQVCPLDGEVTTIGRNPESNLRIYLPDVSGLHAEIKFDLLTGLANLLVHGRNGLIYTPFSGQAEEQHPPSSILLADGDTFSIRKKVWRFSYGDTAVPTTQCMTPLKPTAAAPFPSASRSRTPSSVPRRSSYRLSLMPGDVDFATVSSPRKGMTPKKSALGKEVETEDGHGEMELVDVFDHDDGVKVYFERAKPICENKFMTPQPARKTAAPRNTDAAPRIRKIDFNALAPPAKPALGPAPSPSPVEHESLYPSLATLPVLESPATPPAQVATSSASHEEDSDPSSSVASPTPASRPTPRVTAQVAYSTPKGPASLRKALLLRSARQAWRDTAAGVDGAIDVGLIEVRRKSLSPRTGRRSGGLPVPQDVNEDSEDDEDEAGDEEADDDNEDEREEADQGQRPAGQFEWVYEDGSAADADDSFGSSNSDRDSVDADILSDVPGEMVVQLGTEWVLEHDAASHAAQYEEEDEEEEEEEEEEVEEEEEIEEEEEEFEEEEIEENEGLDHKYGDFAEQELDGADAEQAYAETIGHEAAAEEAAADESDNDDQNVADTPEATPQPRLASRFFTPQPKRQFTVPKPRRSLVDIAGPARRIVTPGRPQATSNISHLAAASPVPALKAPRTPGSSAEKHDRRVGFTAETSVRIISPQAKASPSVAAHAGSTPRKAAPALERLMGAAGGSGEPATPVRATPQRLFGTPGHGATPRATPRPLPAPPSTFKTPVRELGSTMPTPHRALVASPATPTTAAPMAAAATRAPPCPMEAGSSAAPPPTPMDALKTRMRDMRRQSEVRAARRATIDAGRIGATPQRIARPSTALYTTRKDRAAVRPREPTVSPAQGLSKLEHGALDDGLGSGPDEDALDEAECASVLADDEARDAHYSSTPPTRPAPRAHAVPPTPTLTGLREMYALPAAPHTPDLAGVRGLFRADKAAPTPRFDGVKEMLRVHRRGTMHLEGVEEMFAADDEVEDAAVAAHDEAPGTEAAEARGEAVAEPPKRVRRVAASAPTRRAKAATAISAPSAGRRRPAPAVAFVDDDDDDELDCIEVAPAPRAVSAPTRRTKKAEPAADDAADKPAKARRAPARRAADEPAAPAEDKPKRGRRKALEDSLAQPGADADAADAAAPPPATSRKPRAKPAASPGKPSASAPARRGRPPKVQHAEDGQENVPPASAPAAKARAKAARPAAAKAEAAPAVPVPTARATRSRK